MLLRRTAIAAAVLVALAAAASGMWVYVAGRVEAGVARWIEARRAEGWRIGHAGLAVGGYPLRWRARLEKPAATAPGPAAATWTAPVVFVDHVPWHPGRVRVEAPGLHRVDWAAGTAAEVGARHAEAVLDFNGNGHIRRVDATLDDVIVVPAGHAQLSVDRIVAKLGQGDDAAAGGAAEPGDSAKADMSAYQRTALAVHLELLGLTLPADQAPVLGRTIARIAVRAAVLGPVFPGRLPTVLAAWRDAGGTVEVTGLSLGWGPLAADGEGTLALDERLQPQGAMTARLAGFEQTLQALVEARLVQPKHGALVGFALNAMATRPADGGAPYIEAPVTIQEGRLFVGPVALMPLPRIDWAAIDR